MTTKGVMNNVISSGFAKMLPRSAVVTLPRARVVTATKRSDRLAKNAVRKTIDFQAPSKHILSECAQLSQSTDWKKKREILQKNFSSKTLTVFLIYLAGASCLRDSAASEATSDGVIATFTFASLKAAIFDLAVPLSPDMMAPA